MDANDAQSIDNRFNVVKENENQITEKINKQTIFNKEAILRFEIITKHINQEQVIINDFIKHYNNNIYKTLNDEHNEIHLLYVLHNHINNIAESILLTKLNIIPKFILSEGIIKSINEFISNQNVTIVSNEHLYRLLALETYINDSYIIIHVKIPIFNTQMYSLTRIVPLPLKKTKL